MNGNNLHHHEASQTLQWAPTDNISPNQQFQLPESFFIDWPFDVGQGEAFDFLAELQNQSNPFGPGQGNSNEFGNRHDGGNRHGSGQDRDTQGQPQDGDTGAGGGIQDILGVGFPEGFVGAGQIGGVLGSMGGFSNHPEDAGTTGL